MISLACCCRTFVLLMSRGAHIDTCSSYVSGQRPDFFLALPALLNPCLRSADIYYNGRQERWIETMLHRRRSPFLLLHTSLASYLLFSSTCCPCVVGACLVGAGSSVASMLGLLALSVLLGGVIFDVYCDRSSSAYFAFIALRSCCNLCFSSRSALTFFFAK